MRRLVLLDVSDERGTRHEAVSADADGSIRIDGHDTGPGVSAAFGEDITSYEWTYVVDADHVPALLLIVGAPADADPLEAIGTYYAEHGRLGDALRDASVAAAFRNWHG